MDKYLYTNTTALPSLPGTRYVSWDFCSAKCKTGCRTAAAAAAVFVTTGSWWVFRLEIVEITRAFLGTGLSSRDGIPRDRDIPGFPGTG